MENLAFKVRRLRELRNLTQEYVAQQIDVSVKTYQRLEWGTAALTFKRVIQLAKLFGVTLEDLQNFNPNTYQFGQRTVDLQPELQRLQMENTRLTERLNAT